MQTTTLLWSITLLTTAAHCQLIDVPLGIPGKVITVPLKQRFLLYPAILYEINASARRCCTVEPSSEALRKEVRRYLTPKYAEILAETLNQRGDPELVEAQRFFKYLRENFERQQVVNIFESAIDEIYNEISVEKLAAYLHRLYDADTPETYVVIAQAQLYLYWKFLGRGQANDFDRLSVGTYLQDIKNDKFFNLVGENQQLEINRAIDSLKPLYAPIFDLANALSNQTIIEAQAIFSDVMRNYEKRQVIAIVEKSLDKLGDERPIEPLAYELHMMSKGGDLLTLEIMARAQLHLYWKFVNGERLNDQYLLQVAYYLNIIMSDPNYNKADERLKRSLQQAVENLPTALQLVFFRSHFCAQTISGRCQDLTNKRWIQFALTNMNLYKSAGQLHLQFNFANLYDRGNYGCMEFNGINFVLSQEGGRFSNWVLQFINNKLVFNAYGIPLCTRYPKNLKYVTPLASECHFIADDCTGE